MWVTRGILLSCIAIVGPSGIAGAQDEWTVANAAVVRVPPSRFSQLPAAVVADRERRGCRIPQPAEEFGSPELRNVLRGDFTGPGRSEWAVLCSLRDTSQILVYPVTSAAATDSLARAADRGFLQRLANGRPGYSRQISSASPAIIRERTRNPDGPAPPSILDHSGIEDAFLEKASVIYYRYRERWMRLQGTDEP